MTTLLFTFFLSCFLSFVLTPLCAKIGVKAGAVDLPGGRKIHTEVTPRTGGIALFLSFNMALFIVGLFQTKVASLLGFDQKFIYFLIGAAICFFIGIIDDFYSLRPKIKLLFQIVAASVAYFGGIRIGSFELFGMAVDFGPFGYFFTVFWFVLFINAINLIDGLDGLAAGLVFFTAAVMVFLAIFGKNYRMAMLFSILAGINLGFLRYNFNPATVFMGDAGSYFLGYTIAGLAIMGSLKSQVGAITMIPLLSLGVPLFDTIVSPLRRFIMGKKLFAPDDEHVHHRMLKLGFSVKNAVLLIYVITIFLCAIAIVLVNIRNERAGLFLIILGIGAVIFFRKLGYRDQIYSSMISDWATNFSDDFPFFGREHKTFFGMLQELFKAEKFDNLWENTIGILDYLGFDKGSLYLNKPFKKTENDKNAPVPYHSGTMERRKTQPLDSSVILRKAPPELDWVRPPFYMEDYVSSRSILRIELPLISGSEVHLGTLVLIKDMKAKSINHQTLRRVEDLRRTMIRKMEMMASKSLEIGEIQRR